MQNNFDKLNEIFGVKPEGGEETAAKEEALRQSRQGKRQRS